MVRLATGQKAVAFAKSKGVNVTPLTKAKLRDGDGGAASRASPQPSADAC